MRAPVELSCSQSSSYPRTPSRAQTLGELTRTERGGTLAPSPDLAPYSPGGKHANMATAFTAVANDSAFIEANPAASSVQGLTELSFFHNNWVAGTGIESVVYTIRFENLGFGIAGRWLHLPFSEYDISGRRVAKGTYSDIQATAASRTTSSRLRLLRPGARRQREILYRSVPDCTETVKTNNPRLGPKPIRLGHGRCKHSRFNFLKFYSSRRTFPSLWSPGFRPSYP